jgi:polysaccharide biosynthesis/export protein
MLAAAVSGCAGTSSRMTATTKGGAGQVAAQDLDSLAYARSAEQATTARASTPTPIVVAGPVLAVPQQVAAAPPVVVTQVATAVVPSGAAFEGEPPYQLDSGDRLRIVVFGQEGLTNSYFVDASGAITMPLIKTVTARGLTTSELARAITERLRNGFIREPHVAIEVDLYRPFFILGEVTTPGQYAYVPHMTVENAVAIAGGFTPRAYRFDIKLDRPVPGGVTRTKVPPHTRVRPGDTIIVQERWF